jgi:hypothetical protein
MDHLYNGCRRDLSMNHFGKTAFPARYRETTRAAAPDAPGSTARRGIVAAAQHAGTGT